MRTILIVVIVLVVGTIAAFFQPKSPDSSNSFDDLLRYLNCASRYPKSAKDHFWGPETIRVRGATKKQIYDLLLSDVTRRGYTICHELERPSDYNRGKLCVAGCGGTTSLRKGVIVAEGYSRAKPRIGANAGFDYGISYAVWFFLQKDEEIWIELDLGGYGQAGSSDVSEILLSDEYDRYSDSPPPDIIREIEAMFPSTGEE